MKKMMKMKDQEGVYPQKNKDKYSIDFMILLGYAFVYIQLMCYACLSIWIYTTKLHMMGKKSKMLYDITLLII